MLNKIKSIFIIKKVFNNLYDRIQLKLIKYNKKLQNKINIFLYNYKIYSKRYIKYETNNKGEESYYDGQLKYEGEFLNGERNGKGKEYYDNDELKFEGEYLNGKRNGKGKEYGYDRTLSFEGEYLNGKKWNGNGYNNNKIIYSLKDGKGKIKEYDNYTDKLEFEGEYLNGKRNGKGKEYYDNGSLSFEGGYLNGKRNGKGKEYDLDGQLKFEGEYLNGEKWNGNGYNNNNIIYSLKDGKGFIKEYHWDGKLEKFK